MGQRRFFTEEFKTEAVRLMTEQGLPISQVSRDLGVEAGVLRRWRRQHEGLPPRSESGRPATPPMPETEELRRLRRENEAAAARARDPEDGARDCHGAVAMKFRCIRDQRAAVPVRIRCRGLGVSPSGFYAWLQRPGGRRAAADRELSGEIAAIHAASRGTDGCPRVHAELRQRGRRVGRKLSADHGSA